MKIISRILVLLAVLLVITTLILSFSLKGVAGARSLIYDKQYVDALQRVSTLIPQESVLVTSTNSPYIEFFTRRTARVPFGVSSEESLVEFMSGHKYKYLLVSEGSSQVPELRALFSPSGLIDLRDNFIELDYIQTDFTKLHLYEFSPVKVESTDPSGWTIYTIRDIDDFGNPQLSAINSIQIRVTDDGTGPLTVWLGRMSLVDIGTQAETIIETFESGHKYMKQSSSGDQEDDVSCSVNGSQSLKIMTDGDGLGMFTRKSGESRMIDFTGKTIRLWVKVGDPGRLREFRVSISNDGYKNYRDFWINR